MTTLKPAQDYANLLSSDPAKQLILTAAIRQAQAQADALRYAAQFASSGIEQSLIQEANQLEQKP